MKEILLDSNQLQKDLRIRLPKQILSNLPATVGTIFDIYLCPENNDIILRIAKASNCKKDSCEEQEND